MSQRGMGAVSPPKRFKRERWTGRGYWWLCLSILLGWANAGWSQRASNWRAYRLGDGLPESACVSVTFSPQGRLLARHTHLPLISELDGYTLHTMASPESGQSRIYQSPGGQLWTVVPGGLHEFREGTWVAHQL